AILISAKAAGKTSAVSDRFEIVDESGEDYLYYKSLVVFVDLPKNFAKKLIAMERLPNRQQGPDTEWRVALVCPGDSFSDNSIPSSLFTTLRSGWPARKRRKLPGVLR